MANKSSEIREHVCPMHKLAMQPLCAPPDVDGISRKQTAALHMFKHELLAAGYRLYLEIPEKRAAPLVTKFLKQWINQLPEQPDD